MKIYPVILSGGSGTRLWPLSRVALPKQLLPVASDKTMLQETILRLAEVPDVMPPLIICGNDHRFLVAEQLREIGVSATSILLEPEGKNTAPAVAAAAYYLQSLGEDALMLILPADHVIKDASTFRTVIHSAAIAAQDGALATFGIVPTCPETGYGYIRRGKSSAKQLDCYHVDRFVEKPDLATAKEFLRDGDYYWNSGMFLFQSSRYIKELKEFSSDIANCCEAAVTNSYRDLDFCRLDEKAFSACPSDSIDYAVMEHTQHAIVVPADIGWSDVGSWSSLWEVGSKDDGGNVTRGDIYLDNVKNSLVRAESRIVAVIGVEDLVVVETKDAVLVAHKNDTQKVKQTVDYLKKAGRDEHAYHRKVYRPWGSYEGIDIGDRFQVKRITVKPGEKLSLQMHHHRAEHWIVVSGTAQVTYGDEVKLLSENESVYIPLGTVHRLENPGRLPLDLIEVQSGSYLGEDDIVRFEDIYKRV
jgi:mannose-1-phosphate guanylyltransferase/mannose-6-phosphate isomerase